MSHSSTPIFGLAFTLCVFVACSSGGSSGSASGQLASGADAGTSSSESDGGAASDGSSVQRDGGGGGGGTCVGRVVSSVEACGAPCIYNEFVDSSNGPGPSGGQIWCASSCTKDADCINPGEICDVRGPTIPHVCVRSCDSAAACQKVGLPECTPLNDGRSACF